MDINLYTWLVLSALAAFRISEILVIDNGPFGVFERLRGWSLSDNSLLSNIGKALNCVYCTGIYISIVLTIGYFFQNVFIFALIFAFACAGLQSILAKQFGRFG